MKRLKAFILGALPGDDGYQTMYEGAMYDTLAGETIYEAVYWKETIAYSITKSRKNDPTQPNVTVRIPYDELIKSEDMTLKRLKYFLLNLTPNDTTYKSIYEGKMISEMITKSGSPLEFSEEHYEPVYWEIDGNGIRAGIGYEYTQSNKLEKDKPTIKVRIPAEKFGCDFVPETDDMTVHHAFSTQAIAAADACYRQFYRIIDALNRENRNGSRTDEENGAYYYPKPGGEMLACNAAYFAVCTPKYYENGSGIIVYIRDGEQEKFKPKLYLCFTLQVQLPHKKHEKAMRMLCRDLPAAAEELIRTFDREAYCRALRLAEKQESIRQYLKNSPYCAFIANGSILPRDSKTGGAMENALPFQSPKEAEIEIDGIRGMGIRRGVTVITGGGYSGKSTVLDAIACGVYSHAPGDGRELVITDETAVSIAAEDGRSVKNLNISPFIKWIPGGSTADFSTFHASGSTSQAANIMEAAEFGARLLLIDEDSSATNFMIRDRLMKELIQREPITPFTDRVRELAANNISTILVIGGSGEYLAVADAVYLMDSYEMYDVTEKAHQIAAEYGGGTLDSVPEKADFHVSRLLEKTHFSSYPENGRRERLAVSEMGYIIIGEEAVDLRGLYQVLTHEQRQAIGLILREMMIHEKEDVFSVSARLDEWYEKLEREGLDCVYSAVFPECGRFLALPRKQDIAAVIARMRHLTYRKQS